jgi:hypothetical protein
LHGKVKHRVLQSREHLIHHSHWPDGASIGLRITGWGEIEIDRRFSLPCGDVTQFEAPMGSSVEPATLSGYHTIRRSAVGTSKPARLTLSLVRHKSDSIHKGHDKPKSANHRKVRQSLIITVWA